MICSKSIPEGPGYNSCAEKSDCCVFIKKDFFGEYKNLLFPIETLVFIDGVSKFDSIQFNVAANEFNVVNLIEEYGIVMILQQGAVRVKVAGSEAIEQYIEQFHKSNLIDLEAF